MSIVLHAQGTDDPEVIDRLQRAVGSEGLQRIRSCRVAVIGIGVLGRRISASLGRKGYSLLLVDHDTVYPANLHQGFRPSDVGENKAVAAAKAIAGESPFPISITAIPSAFEEAVGGLGLECDIAVAVTHDYASRFAICEHYYSKVPVVSAGIGANLLFSWVFIQRPGEAYLKCVLPVEVEGTNPCPAGMVSSIAEATAALVCFAVDSLVLPEQWPRLWNYRVLSFSGDYEVIRTVERRAGCRLCQG